jgi:hypothetical protein
MLQETIRKANIATFISSILGVHDVSFFKYLSGWSKVQCQHAR